MNNNQIYHKRIPFFLLLTFSLIFINMGLVSSFSGSGDGSSGNPFQITNCTQLQEMNDSLSSSYVLMNDINCSDTINWNWNVSNGNIIGFFPIGLISPFSGNLDGNEYKITDLYIYATNSSSGLFYKISRSGSVSNLTLQDYRITSVYYIENAFYNYVSSLAAINNGTIYNCKAIDGNVSSTSFAKGETFVLGSLVGVNYYKLFNSYSSGNVFGSSSHNVACGGLVGYNDNAQINNCSSSSVVNCWTSGTETPYGGIAGGLIGYNYNAVVNNSYSTGKVSYIAYSSYDGTNAIGGFVGLNNGNIYNSYSTGNITAQNLGYVRTGVGGFAGKSFSSTIYNSYSTGYLGSTSYYGGFLGYNQGGTTLHNCFYDTNTSGIAGGKTTSQMKDIRTFTNLSYNLNLISPVYDFFGTQYNDNLTQNIWNINSLINDGYPYLFSYNFNVTLNSPNNGSSTTDNVIFNCSSTSQSNLVNSTLFIWNTTGELIYSNTQNITGLSNISISNYTFVNESYYLWNCLFSDESNFSVSASNYTFYSSVLIPAINLLSPTNNQYLNYNNNINLSFYASDFHNISVCELWENFTGNWNKNTSWITPINEQTKYILLNLTDNYYNWNVWCNDTLDNGGYALSNFSFTVDTLPPIINNNISITTSQNAILFKTNITGSNICYYTILDENNSVNGLSNNVSFICNSLTGASTFGYGNFTLVTDNYDYSGNYIQQNQNFTTTYVAPPTGGNPPPTLPNTPVISTGQPVLTSGNWTMETELGGNKYQFNMIQNSNRTRDMLFENLGVSERTITMKCVKVSGLEDLCEGITFKQDTFILPTQKSIKTSNTFIVSIPSTYEKGTYVVNLVGEDENSNIGVITLEVKVTSRASIAGIISKLFVFPYFLIFLLVAIVFGVLSNYLIFKPTKLPSALSVIVGLVFGIIFLLLPF